MEITEYYNNLTVEMGWLDAFATIKSHFGSDWNNVPKG